MKRCKVCGREYRTGRLRARIAIAKDVIAWVKAGALIPAWGNYVSPLKYPRSDPPGGEQQARDMTLGPCRVCGLGALFLAHIVRFDRYTATEFVHNYDSRWGIVDRLNEHFSDEELNAVESAFECVATTPDDCSAAIAFGQRHSNDRARLTAIMQNIIDNGGTFKP